MTTLHCPLGIPLLAWNEPGANRCESLPRRSSRSRSSSRTMQEIEKFRSDFMFTWKNKRKIERKRRGKRTARTAA